MENNYVYLEIVDNEYKNEVRGQLVKLIEKNFGYDTDDILELGETITLKISKSLKITYCINADRIMYKTIRNIINKTGSRFIKIDKDEYRKFDKDDADNEI